MEINKKNLKTIGFKREGDFEYHLDNFRIMILGNKYIFVHGSRIISEVNNIEDILKLKSNEYFK